VKVVRPKSAASAKIAKKSFMKKQSQAPKNGPFAIKVFFVGSSTPPISLVVSRSDSMDTIKRKIEFQHGIPAERMHLFVGNRQIEMTAGGGPTVGSVGLKPGQELSVAT
jgi:hypothetical protein